MEGFGGLLPWTVGYLVVLGDFELLWMMQGMESYCVRAFAEAMEVVPYTLAENAGLNPIQIVTELRNKHAAGEKYAGINVRKNSISDMLVENVVQPLLVTSSALTLACECVRMILKVCYSHCFSHPSPGICLHIMSYILKIAYHMAKMDCIENGVESSVLLACRSMTLYPASRVYHSMHAGNLFSGDWRNLLAL